MFLIPDWILVLFATNYILGFLIVVYSCIVNRSPRFWTFQMISPICFILCTAQFIPIVMLYTYVYDMYSKKIFDICNYVLYRVDKYFNVRNGLVNSYPILIWHNKELNKSLKLDTYNSILDIDENCKIIKIIDDKNYVVVKTNTILQRSDVYIADIKTKSEIVLLFTVNLNTMIMEVTDLCSFKPATFRYYYKHYDMRCFCQNHNSDKNTNILVLTYFNLGIIDMTIKQLQTIVIYDISNIKQPCKVFETNAVKNNDKNIVLKIKNKILFRYSSKLQFIDHPLFSEEDKFKIIDLATFEIADVNVVNKDMKHINRKGYSEDMMMINIADNKFMICKAYNKKHNIMHIIDIYELQGNTIVNIDTIIMNANEINYHKNVLCGHNLDMYVGVKKALIYNIKTNKRNTIKLPLCVGFYECYDNVLMVYTISKMSDDKIMRINTNSEISNIHDITYNLFGNRPGSIVAFGRYTLLIIDCTVNNIFDKILALVFKLTSYKLRKYVLFDNTTMEEIVIIPYYFSKESQTEYNKTECGDLIVTTDINRKSICDGIMNNSGIIKEVSNIIYDYSI